MSVVTPTTTHFEIAKIALEMNCHVLIEKPITKNTRQAKELVEISEAKNSNKYLRGYKKKENWVINTIKLFNLRLWLNLIPNQQDSSGQKEFKNILEKS